MGKPKNIDPNSVAAYEGSRHIRTKCAQAWMRHLQHVYPNGATCKEFEAATGWHHETASSTARALELSGNIRKSGMVRPNSSGRDANVYVAAGQLTAPMPVPAAPEDAAQAVMAL